jgi:hypothetical protein
VAPLVWRRPVPVTVDFSADGAETLARAMTGPPAGGAVTEADPVAGPDVGAVTRPVAELCDGGWTRTVASPEESAGLSPSFGPAAAVVVDELDVDDAAGLASTGLAAAFATSGIATFVGSGGVPASGAGVTGGVFAGLGVGVYDDEENGARVEADDAPSPDADGPGDVEAGLGESPALGASAEDRAGAVSALAFSVEGSPAVVEAPAAPDLACVSVIDPSCSLGCSP